MHVHHQPHPPFGVQAGLEHQRDVLELFALPGIGVRLLVGDQTGRALQNLGDDPQVVGAQGTARFGDLHDRVGQAGRLDFGRTPGELHARGHAVLRQESRGQAHRFGGDALALQVRHASARASRSGTHSTHRTGRRLTFENVSSHTSITCGVAFQDPVPSR